MARSGWTGKQRLTEVRRFDTTQLTEANRGHLVHRDYAAHFFRWGWAKRFVRGGETRILDIGCGRTTPLARVLKGNLSSVPKKYVGVDYGKVDARAHNFWVETREDFDFTSRWKELRPAQFDLVVSFESIEHMSARDGRRLLAGAKALLAPHGTFLLSTPVFNGRAAASHIHEWGIDELRAAVEKAGFSIHARYGTFASYPDIKKVVTPGDLSVLEQLRKFYDDDVAACFLAPMYPSASRNCAWVLHQGGDHA